MISKCTQTYKHTCGIEPNAPLFIHTYKLVLILKAVRQAEKNFWKLYWIFILFISRLDLVLEYYYPGIMSKFIKLSIAKCNKLQMIRNILYILFFKKYYTIGERTWTCTTNSHLCIFLRTHIFLDNNDREKG